MGLSNYIPSSRVSQAGVCTSSTRPASPYEGQVIYETDTDKTLVYNGSTWVGVYAEINGNTEIGAALADTDTFNVYDASATDNRKTFMSRIATYIFGKVGGEATISSTGTLTVTSPSNTNVTYNTGWQNYAFGYGPAHYTKSPGGIVTLGGLSTRSSGSNAIMFTLPSGYRPTLNLIFACAGSGGVARIDVDSSGNVYYNGSLSGSVNGADWVSVGGVTFLATS
jgi:hypothetical protein